MIVIVIVGFVGFVAVRKTVSLRERYPASKRGRRRLQKIEGTFAVGWVSVVASSVEEGGLWVVVEGMEKGGWCLMPEGWLFGGWLAEDFQVEGKQVGQLPFEERLGDL